MKQTPLKRKTPLRSRASLKRKTPLRPKSKLRRRKDNTGSTYWRNKADKKWAEYIHLPGYCAMCKTGCMIRKLDAHHLITKRYARTRCRPLNGILLCSVCHTTSNYLSAHGHAVAFGKWMEENRLDQFKWIMENKYVPGKADYQADYESLCKLLEAVDG